jgi:hypothetical protein
MTSTEQEQYIKSMFDYESNAFEAAESGDYSTAITIWTTILGDDQQRACFSQEALKEMAFNLAAAYYLSGDDSSFAKIAGDWSISSEDQQKIKDSVEEGE